MLMRLIAFTARHPLWIALIAGVVSATGFAPLGFWPLTLFSFALLMMQVAQAPSGRRAFAIGWLFGMGHFTLGDHWIATAFTYQAAMPAWLGWLAVPLLSLLLAMYPALTAWGAWWFRRRLTPNMAITLPFAMLWIITEWLRSWVFTGFAWNPLGAIWLADVDGWTPLVARSLSWIGTYGLSGLTIIMAGVLGSVVMPIAMYLMMRGKLPFATIRKPLLSLIALLALIYLPGAWGAGQQSPTRVTVVQPNIDQSDKWDLDHRRANFARLANLSRRERDEAPRLLLWPEAAIPDYLEDGYPIDWYLEPPSFTRARVAGLLGPQDILLTGAVRLETSRDRSQVIGARNAMFVVNADRQILGRYDKSHLVPYGEYLPMRWILEPIGLSRLTPGDFDFWPGPGPRTLDLGRFGKVGIQICYEIIFSGQVVDRANRPAFLFNPSNDAWFGGFGPPQHQAQARMRAIEEGLSVIRSTPTGISAIVAPNGIVVQHVRQHVAGRIDAQVPQAYAPTLFAQFGNILPLAFAVFLGLIAIVFARRAR